ARRHRALSVPLGQRTTDNGQRTTGNGEQGTCQRVEPCDTNRSVHARGCSAEDRCLPPDDREISAAPADARANRSLREFAPMISLDNLANPQRRALDLV